MRTPKTCISVFSFINFSNWFRFFLLLGQGLHFSFELVTLRHLWFGWVYMFSVAILMSSNLIRVIIFISIHFFITAVIIFKGTFIFITWKVAIIIFVLIVWSGISFAVIFIEELSLFVVGLFFVRVTILYIIDVCCVCLLPGKVISNTIWVESRLLKMMLLSNLK